MTLYPFQYRSEVAAFGSDQGTDLKKSRFTDEQIVGFLRQAEAGVAVKQLCRTNGFSDARYLNVRSVAVMNV